MNKYIKNLLIVAASVALSTGTFFTGRNLGYTKGHVEGINYSEQNQAKYTLRIHKDINQKGFLDNLSLVVFDPKKNNSEEYFFMSGKTTLDQILNQQHRINSGELQRVLYNDEQGYWKNIRVKVNPILTLELYQNDKKGY
ncbi:MAG: hypothetical protein ACP5NV_00085 [Candidatus Woesearchaeota archaeon]